MKVLCQRRGFTLVELLVVVVIVAVIAAILIPVFQRARDPRRYGSCQSNLKQIGLGLVQYTQDYDERWPRLAALAVSSSTEPFASPYGWADLLYPYLRTRRLFQCPSEDTFEVGVDATRTGFTLLWVQCPAACGVVFEVRVCVEVRA